MRNGLFRDALRISLGQYARGLTFHALGRARAPDHNNLEVSIFGANPVR